MSGQLRLRIGTRGSHLALWQTQHVVERLTATRPDVTFDVLTIRTSGDEQADVALRRLGDRGVFTRAIDDHLREGAIDLAVHSLKDLPVEPSDGLAIGAVLERDDPRDVLVSRSGQVLADLPPGARIGTSSLRRRAQLMALRPQVSVEDMRGNVPTRLDKVRAAEYAAAVLAYAGLRRLGLDSAVTEVFEPDRLLPAPGQGALAIHVRAGDRGVADLLRGVDHAQTRLATWSERAVLTALHGGCQAPIAALGSWEAPTTLRLTALVASIDGQLVLRAVEVAPVSTEAEATALGQRVAGRLREAGADTVIHDARAAMMELPAPES
jgi:hydroxymethylbilane synthase